ncbi:MAG: DUF167 domain-containing protein [Patescibacteria group bacterium]
MYVRVHAKPGSRKETVTHGKEGELFISVKEKAEGNQANKRLRELVALTYALPENKVRILSGHHSPVKLFTLDTD